MTSWIRVLTITLVCAAGCVREAAPPEPTGEAHEREEAHEAGVVVLAPEVLARAGIRTAVVEARGLGGEIATTGQVDFDQSRVAHVSPRISGRVDRVHADLGQSVTKGAVLLVLDSVELAEAKSAYFQAQAREALTQQSFDREEALHAERISSQKDVDEARAAHREATAARRASEERLTLYGLAAKEVASLREDGPRSSLLPIRSPIVGKVVEKHATVGEVVSPERNLMTVADLSTVWIWIDVHERDIQKVHLGDEARVQAASQVSTLINGRVSYVSDQVDVATRTIRARIDVANQGEVVRPGEFARVWLHDPHAAPAEGTAGPAVPETAIQRRGETALVFVLAGPGRFQARPVVLGQRVGDWVEVLTGVQVGETIAVEGTFVLKSELSAEEMGGGHSH